MARQRNRVPTSCLNCRKRKVRCDKAKPVCGGCIRNGVQHSCTYLEPSWSTSVDDDLQQSPVQPLEELLRLQFQSERTIGTQRKEIEDLKRQLAVLQQLLPRVDALDSQRFVTILNKLCPASVFNRDKLKISDDLSYSILSKTITKSMHTDTFNWVNLIKLDPQLTTLWFKITNLQKIYHTYKMNMLKTPANIPSPYKKSPYRINEIDFTYSTTPPNSLDHRCPVIECDFNFMSEEQSTPSPHSSHSPRPITAPTLAPSVSLRTKPSPLDDTDEKAKIVLLKLQNLWNSTLTLARGNDKINYKQLYFLIDFYFNNDDYDAESKGLFSFYKKDIQNIIKKNGTEISLNLVNGPSQDMNDETLFCRLNMKGIYLGMLAIIVEESLDVLRLHITTMAEPMSSTFKALFPAEVIYAGLGYKSTNIHQTILDFILNTTSLRGDIYNPSLGYLSCSIGLLNRFVSVYKKQGNDTKSAFTAVLTILLRTILKEDFAIEIWKDPELVVFAENEAKRKNKELKIHLCHLWTDLIRLANLATFSIVPLIKHSEKLDSLLKVLYTKVEEADSVLYHLKYITKLDSENLEDLTITLHVHYLIARISSTLSHGITKIGDPKLTVSTIEELIKQCSTWILDPAIQRLRYIRKFEVYTLLHYLRYFMQYVLLLQGEESEDEDLIQSLIPSLFSRYYGYVIYLQNEIKNFNPLYSQYVLLSVTELLTRLIQFVVGVLMRFHENSEALELLRKQVKLHAAPIMEKSISDEVIPVKDFVFVNIVSVVEDTVALLEKSSLFDQEKSAKLTKLWNFYMTFVKNSTKMSTINYAKIHSDVPGFNGLQPVEKCPVLANEMDPTSSPNSKFTRCPISQITTMDDVKPPSGHPDIVSKKRKCPFDHTAIKKGIRPSLESNIRGESPKGSQYLKSLSLRSLPLGTIPHRSLPLNPELKMEPKSDQEPSPDIKLEALAGFSPATGFDAQAFTDFDFDFLQNEAIFEQINFGPLDNGSMEDSFQ